ncbi:D-alanyl-D-alanine carboxypeptidase family protein [Microbacterium jiangjiandongii]|uniref:D-alanyl-D-alanine carboxypeptidase family protein n=1 Tax=Microbacterium jiangjiandongii TaxID=3049071 RepID=UPI00214B97B7|nr:D-alanyl-D-alanine carboxypeptidase [Microbacterium sp. zg.Y843]MCR2816465.1 D-alanyl-D-alanine carboxypeptidase [Microbacterium sp. zg.Y843]
MTTGHSAPDALEDFAGLLREAPTVEPGSARRQSRPTAPIDPEERRTRRRRRLLATAIVLVLALGGGGGYTGWALTAPVAEPVAASQVPEVTTPPAADIALPAEGASAIAISGAADYLGTEDGSIWATTGTEEPRPIASITKLITALVVLDAHPLADATDPGPTLTFGRADHALYDKYYVMGATIAPMPIGSSLSLHDAIATMLIPSACNYAEAVAGWAFGSQGAFLRATRDWLAANGLTQTTIVEPTGINPRNTSTPGDLITLGRIAAAHPTVAAIAANPGLSLPGPGWMNNTNSLLGQSGITGLKTGTLDPGGSNLLYTASLDVGIGAPLDIVGVLLGASSRASVNHSVSTLLESIAGGFTEMTVARHGQEVGSFSTPWGSTARMVLGEEAALLVWSDTPIVATMQTSTPTTWKDGEVIGSATWTAGPRAVTVPVELDGTIAPPTSWWRLTNPGELG